MFDCAQGLASALMGSKETVPSIAAWSGKKELRRVRWEFQDTSTDGLVKWVALAVSEHYKVRAAQHALSQSLAPH
jgi:hypothetical protein